jgi:hypothetical protein
MHKFEVHFPQGQVTVIEKLQIDRIIDTEKLARRAEKLFGYEHIGSGYHFIVPDAPLDQVIQVMNWWREEFYKQGAHLGFAS